MATRQLLRPDTLAKTDFYHAVCVSEGRRRIHISGQIAFDLHRNVHGGDSLEAQTRYALTNVKLAIEVGGGRLEDVVKFIIYVVGYKPEQRDVITKVWFEFLPEAERPPCTLIGVKTLAVPGLLIEIDAEAIID